MASKLTVNRGTTFVITVTYTNTETGNDITGATVRFTVKNVESDQVVDDSSAMIEKNVSVHTDPVNGVTQITLLPNDTKLVLPGTYFYDLKIEFDSDTVYKLDEGKFILDGSPTNRIT